MARLRLSPPAFALAVSVCVLSVLSAAEPAPEPIASDSALSASIPPGLAGIWENRERFVEIAADGRLRIVLKTYYSFVYESHAWMPARAENLVDAGEAALSGSLAIKYPRAKGEGVVPVAAIGDGLFLRYLRRVPMPTTGNSVNAGDEASVGDGLGAGSERVPGGEPSLRGTVAIDEGEAPAAASVAAAGGLDGFWLAEGSARGILLYPAEPVTEFYSYVFSGNEYRKVRYWLTDARYRDLFVGVLARAGSTLSGLDAIKVPKFIRVGELLYTCVTGTGKILRNTERGTWTLADGFIELTPVGERPYPDEGRRFRATRSSDGNLLALGEPYLSRSSVAALDAEIAAHNARRRPPRKPLLEFMKLDFLWDEIERIRNNGKAPGE